MSRQPMDLIIRGYLKTRDLECQVLGFYVYMYVYVCGGLLLLLCLTWRDSPMNDEDLREGMESRYTRAWNGRRNGRLGATGSVRR